MIISFNKIRFYDVLISQILITDVQSKRNWWVEPVGTKIFGPGPDLLSIFGPGTRSRLIKICQTRTRYFFTCLIFEKFFFSVYIWWSLQKLIISSFPLMCMDD
jgi:hypothetical protein